MPDAADYAAMFTSLKAITDLAKFFIDARDTSVVRVKAIELQREIMTAQQGALTAQLAQSALLKQVNELEAQVANLKAWDTEKQKYQLTQVRPQGAPGGSAFVYALNKNVSSTEPDHSICPNCYEDGKKSVLQSVSLQIGHVVIVCCHRCNLKINLTGIEYGTQLIQGAPLRHRPK